MVALPDALILGIIQGITEWLPVSSSGHLVLAQQYLGLRVPVLFDVLLHLATLIVIFLVFRKDILEILGALCRRDFKSEEGRLFLFIVLGSVPAALIGFTFRDALAAMFQSTLTVGAALLVTGFILFSSGFARPGKGLTWKNSLIVGVFQGLAIIPGISRSGATIGSGLLSGVGRERIVRFSFLLSVPAIIGATLFLLDDISLIDPAPMAAGMLASILVGYFSLKLVIKTVLNRRFHLFAIYCWAAGAAVIALSLA
jgi:undecaprenyl-diphosphatase